MTAWTQDFLGPLTLDTVGTYQPTALDFASDAGATTLTATVNVFAASADLLAAAVEALVAQLRIGNMYVRYQPGVTNPVVYRILSVDSLALGNLTWQANWQKVSFTLTLAGAPAGALQTPYNAQTVNLPASVALNTLIGTRPTQLDVLLADASGLNLHSVWAALAPTALTDAQWLVLASALTWTSMTNGTGATMWGNTSRYTTSGAFQTASLDTSKYPAGKYRLLVRASQSAGTGYVMDSQNRAPIAITRTSQNLQVVGDVDLPVQDTPWGTASNLTLYVRSDGGNTLTVNAFVLLPLDLGYYSWHPDSLPALETQRLDVGPTGTFIYDVTTGYGACDLTYLLGGPLEPAILAAHTGTIIPTASPSGSTWPTDWGRTDGVNITANASRIAIVGTAAIEQAWYAATVAGTPNVVAYQWYQLDITRQVTPWVSGSASVSLAWLDVDGNAVRTDVLSTVSAADGSPVALTFFVRAPIHAVRAKLLVGTTAAGSLTAYFYAAALRRCPLKLLLVAEDALGALNGSFVTPTTLTVKYTPRYEVAR